MADPVVHITNGVPDSGTGNITTLGQVLAALPAALGAGGGLKVDGSGTPLPVSGTFWQATQPVSLASVPSHAVTNAGTFAVQVTSAPTTAVTGTFFQATQPISAASLPLPSGAATSALQPTAATLGSTTSGQSGHLIMGAVTTAAPTYTTAQTNALSLDTTGALRVNVTAGGGAGGTSSNVGSAAPTVATAIGFSDGTNLQLGVIKAASTAPAATDRAIVVAISPNSVNANGSATSANSAPVVIASDQAAVAVKVALSASANGLTKSRVTAAASTNANSLKTSAGNIASIDLFNNAAYPVFFKLYNKASAPTVGTDTPVWTIPIAAGGGFSREFALGDSFSTGISYAITKLLADTDTTVLVAGDVVGQIRWI